MPIVTDFTRTTQPIVRYRLDDVLVASEQPCPVAVQQWRLRVSKGGRMTNCNYQQDPAIFRPFFADACSRVLAMTLPLTVDYRLLQTGSAQLTLIADCELWMLEHCRGVECLVYTPGYRCPKAINLVAGTANCASLFTAKRRRIASVGAGMSNSLLRPKQMLLGWGTVGVIQL